MRTVRAKAPQNLERLLSLGFIKFTVSNIAQHLDLTYREARAAVVFGVQTEKLWIVKSRQEAGEQWALMKTLDGAENGSRSHGDYKANRYYRVA